MKFLIAPNAFKGSLSAKNAATSIERGIKQIFPSAEIVTIPVSDGGDGFIDALEAGLSAKSYQVTVTGPTEKSQLATFLYAEDKEIAIIEMAVASGLALLKPEEYDPMHTTTEGVGELILSALELGAEHIVLGIGGSATNDGGTGMASALGIKFLDRYSNNLKGNAANLSKIARIDLTDLDPRLKSVSIDVACDVNNPLLGKDGAANVYGPQKGANTEQVLEIENGLSHFSEIIRKETGIDVTTLIGGGAAGGMGAGLYAFLGASLKPGADVLLDIMQFDREVENADLVITTEGKLDFQTGFGKAPAIVASRSGKYNVPVLAIAGQVEGDDIDWKSMGFKFVDSLCRPGISAEYAMANAAELLEKRTVENIQQIKDELRLADHS